MAKGETKKTNQMLEQQRTQQQATYRPLLNNAMGQQQGAQANRDTLYGDLYKQYSGLAAGQGLGGAGGGGGGYAVSAPQYQKTNFDPTRPTYEEFQKTGGVDMSKLEMTNPFFQKMMETGGLDAEAMNRFRGGGVFDEMARTGGYSDVDKANIRSRGAATGAAAYGAGTEQMNQAARIRGGAVNPAVAMRMARERSRGLAEGSLNTELGINENVRSGRMAGASAMSGAEAQLQGLRTGNMMGAGNALQTGNLNNQRLVQGGRMWGTEGVGGIEQQIAAEANRQAEANASAANASASNAASAARYNDSLRMAGIEGLQGLRGDESDWAMGQSGNYLQGAGSLYGLGNEQLGMRYNAPGNQGTNWGNVIGGVAGLAGGLLTGGAGLAVPALIGGKKKPGTTS